MIRLSIMLAAMAGSVVVPAAPVFAASFDCSKAVTPFETAICENERLSQADDRLARTYATAIGGLSEAAIAGLRAGQRDWLGFARRACTEDAEPLWQGAYDGNAVDCLATIFNARSTVLENSRMIEGLRFYPAGNYTALPDPDAESGSSWAVATHELSFVQLDESLDFTDAFNALVRDESVEMQGGYDVDDGKASIADDPSSTSDNAIVVEEVAGQNRITLSATTYWYGHGAAHGNYTTSSLHFLRDQGRWMEAKDLFTGNDWREKLTELTIQALEAEHGDNLMMDGADYITEIVSNPRRWSFSDTYGLVIQFQPYEVSAYAYGAPTATVSWISLEPYLVENADAVRYGTQF